MTRFVLRELEMNFIDPNLIVVVVTNVVLATIFIIRLEGKIKGVSENVGRVETDVKALNATDKRLSVMEERVNNLVSMLSTALKTIEDLRRGVGFIKTERASVDGSY